MAKEFLGTGWAFPVRINGQGGNALVSAEEDIKQACLIILSTALGERAMRPDFGCGIYDLVFDPGDASLAGRIEFFVSNALEAWEPRITVKSVEAEMTEEKVVVEVRYVIRTTNTEDNFVYPFFTAA